MHHSRPRLGEVVAKLTARREANSVVAAYANKDMGRFARG